MQKKSVIITGASGVYAKCLAEVFNKNNWLTIGITRNKDFTYQYYDNLIHANIANDESIETIRTRLSELDITISCIIAAAGKRSPTDGIGNLTGEELIDLFNINCASAVRVFNASRSWHDRPLKFVAITSRFGSFDQHAKGLLHGHRPLYSYSTAKAALNMLLIRMREEFPPSALQLYTVHPGRLKAGINAIDATDEPIDSAHRLLNYIQTDPPDFPVLYDVMHAEVLGW
jgi:NAD(P)-dependent dehydrogenase (short-subunit alcohol dehydrogenase family)